ncbi:alpha/beta fold hydrolase [Yaniella flava]|uniref:alpha/beta fold hydrolase n=1 Tax=Yaniella flava TaxID=287930 RepID=UPI0031DEA61D
MKKQRFIIIFENGLMSGPSSWAWVASRLEPSKYEVILVQRAAESAFDACFRKQNYTAVLERQLANIGFEDRAEPVILVGHSVGALLVRAHAHYFGSRVAGLVLVDPSPPAQFTPGADTNFSYLRLNQALLRRIVRTFFGGKLPPEELDGVQQLPPESSNTMSLEMRKSKFWIDAYRESKSAAKLWVESGLSPQQTKLITSVVSTDVLGFSNSIQSRFVQEILANSASSASFENREATHESILFNEQHSQLVNNAIEWTVSKWHEIQSEVEK